MPWYYLLAIALLILLTAVAAAFLLLRRVPPTPPPKMVELPTPGPLQAPPEVSVALQAPPEKPVRIGPDPLEISLVEYTTPDLIPPFLRPVAFVTSTVIPDHIVRVTDSWFASKDIAPAGRVCFGAVKYATYDLVPAALKVYGSAIAVIAGTPVPITDGRSLKFNDKTNSMHLATVGV